MPSRAMPELRRMRQLAMLQREAVVAHGLFFQRSVQRFDGKLGRLITIGMGMDLDPGLQRALIDFGQLFRGDIPHAVGRAVQIARPQKPRGKALDQAVEMTLIRPRSPSARGRTRLVPGHELDQLAGVMPSMMPKRHEAKRKILVPGGS